MPTSTMIIVFGSWVIILILSVVSFIWSKDKERKEE